MTDHKFDLDSVLNTYRDTFAPVVKVQQKGLQTLERLARYQFAVAGDYLDWSIAHANVGVTSNNLADGVAKHTELNSRLGDKLRARAQEFSQIANETQGAVSQWFNQAGAEVVRKTAEVVRKTKKAA
jgi:hypothetical protein